MEEPVALDAPSDTKTQVGFGGTSADPNNQQSLHERMVGYHNEALKTAENTRARHDLVWPENDRFFHHDMWPSGRPKWRSAPVTNFCKSAIVPMVALLTDNRPRPEVQPLEPGLSPLAASLGAAMDFVFHDQDFGLLLPQVLTTAAINGSGFLSVSHDPWRPNRLILSEKDIYNVFALGGTDIERCSHFWYRDWMSLSEIRAYYPEHGAKVKDEEPESSPRVRPREILRQIVEDAPNYRSTSSGTPDNRTRPGSNPDQADWPHHGKGAWVWQFFYKDMSVKPDGTRFFPFWRWVTIANGVVLKDRPIEEEIASGLIPVVKFNNYDWPGEFWGASELEDIKRLNVIHNLVFGLILDLIRLGASPPLLVPVLSGLDSTKYMARPGLVLDYDSRGGDPHWMPPPVISRSMIDILSLVETLIRTMTGMGEISEGALPFKGASGVLVAQLRELSQTRLRHKSRILEVAIKRLGERVLFMIQQFWKMREIIPLVGDVDEEKMAAFHPETVQMDPVSRRAFVVINEIADVDPVTGEYVRLNNLAAGRFAVRVNTVSTLVDNKRQRMVEAIELAKSGVLDPEGAREYSPLPEPVKARMRARERAKQQAAMAAQQGPPPDQGGRPAEPLTNESLAIPLETRMGSTETPLESGIAVPSPDQLASGGAVPRVQV